MKLYTYNSVFERIERPREFPEIHRQNVKGVRLRDVDEGGRVVEVVPQPRPEDVDEGHLFAGDLLAVLVGARHFVDLLRALVVSSLNSDILSY